MKYKGIELNKFTSDRPVLFDTPKKMLVWDEGFDDALVLDVFAYLPWRPLPVIGHTRTWKYCAEIPVEPKPRRATEMELARWLAQGNGCFTNVDGDYCWTSTEYDGTNPGKECNPDWRVRKWDDKEWHEPTADYMGLEG